MRHLSSPGKFGDVALEVRTGEVVGLAGLVGAGRSEIAQAIFGLDGAATGELDLFGERRWFDSPRQAMLAGIGLVPEDRKRQGLVMGLAARDNISLPTLRRRARLGFIRQSADAALAREYFQKLRVRAPSIEAVVAGLSGGNQQKIVLAKWLAATSRVLILDEPTRGVDVGAKAEIHQLIDQLACDGVAVLLISSELPELMKLSRRVYVLREGQVMGMLEREELRQDSILRLMTR